MLASAAPATAPRLVLILSENWTMTSPRDLRALVGIAQQTEEADMRPLVQAMHAAGRDMSELEVVGGIRGRFPSPGTVADLDEAAAAIPAQLATGYTTFCFKPSQFADDPAQVGALCRRLVALSGR